MPGRQCGVCSNKCTRYDDHLSCSTCEAHFHIKCIGMDFTTFDALRTESSQGDSWSCESCRGDASRGVNVSAVSSVSDRDVAGVAGGSLPESFESLLLARFDRMERKFVEISGQLLNQTSEISALRAEIAQLREENLNLRQAAASSQSNSAAAQPQVQAGATYATVAACKASVIVRPKAPQSNATTKADLYRSVNPAEASVGVSTVRHVSGGGLLVRCSTEENASNFKKLVEDGLSDKYSVKNLPKLHPRLKIIGMTEKLDSPVFLELIKKQNPDIFTSKSDIVILSIQLVKTGSRFYQALLQTDLSTYNAALGAKRLFVGYDSCSVYDALIVPRCFNCSGFNHQSKECKGKTTCPRCGGSHSVKQCTAEQLKCPNCTVAQKIFPDCDLCHAAWDRTCPAFMRKQELFRAEILGCK